MDRTLSGPFSRWQLAYREGVRTLNAYIGQRCGRKFFELSKPNQDEAVGELQGDEVPGFADFFTMVWSHTIEGIFSDPAYGGDREAVGGSS